MQQDSTHAGNLVLIRGAALWLLMALALAWCMVGLNFGVPVLPTIFQGKLTRLVQAHLDFLLMSALLFGFYAAKVPLAWHVRWAMVVGAFTNSSLFLMQAVFPMLDAPVPPDSVLVGAFRLYSLVSIVVASYGFGKGAVTVLKSTF